MRHRCPQRRVSLGAIALLLGAFHGSPAAPAGDPVPAAAATPTPAPVSPRVNVAGQGTRIETVVAILNQQIESRITIRPSASGLRVSVTADGVPLEEALTQIAEPIGLVWWREPNGNYSIGSAYDRDHSGPNDPAWRDHPEWIPPTPDSTTPKVEVAGSDTKIETIVQMLNQQTPHRIAIHGRVVGQRVSILADGVPLEECLDSMAKPNDWVWWREKDGSYGLGDKDYYLMQVAGLPPSPPTPTPDPEIERKAGEVEARLKLHEERINEILEQRLREKQGTADAATSSTLRSSKRASREMDEDRSNRMRKHEARIRAILEERRLAFERFQQDVKAGLATPFPTPAAGLPPGMDEIKWQRKAFSEKRAQEAQPALPAKP